MSQQAAETTRLGSFELLTRIARGGMAEIYLARQANVPGFERLVVVKRILPQHAEDPNFVRMFLEEARLAALISHPNVVQIHDVGMQDGQYFIAMEHITGVTVSALLGEARRDGSRLPVAGALEIAVQTCAGLEAAHQLRDVSGNPLGVVHRDVSPQNLMVTRDGLVKVLDFGIAKATTSSRATEAGSLKGKFPYLSPEQVRAQPIDARSDQFSLGTVLYELLTGTCPFERPTALQILAALDECNVPPPSQLAPVPADVDRLVLRALSREPGGRFPSAAEMGRAARTALEAMGHRSGPDLLREGIVASFDALFSAEREVVDDAVSSVRTRPPFPETRSGQPTRAEPLGPAEKERGARRRRIAWLSATAAVLVIAAVGGWVAWPERGSSPSAGGVMVADATGASAPAAPPPLRGKPLRFGAPPIMPAEILRREIAPLTDLLARRMGRPVQLTVAASYEEVTRAIATGALDLAKLTPLQYVRAKQAEPAIRLLAGESYEGSATYEGYLVTLDDLPIESVDDLRGRRPCWVEPGSASGYLLPRTYLRRQGLDPDRDLLTPVTSGDHIAVLRDLLAGKCEVGAVASGRLLVARELSMPVGRFRILASTGRLPMDAFVASPHLSADDASRIQAILFALNPARDLGVPAIGSSLRIGGFVPATDELFDPVRRADAEEREQTP